jgi:hypothetical protein
VHHIFLRSGHVTLWVALVIQVPLGFALAKYDNSFSFAWFAWIAVFGCVQVIQLLRGRMISEDKDLLKNTDTGKLVTLCLPS